MPLDNTLSELATNAVQKSEECKINGDFKNALKHVKEAIASLEAIALLETADIQLLEKCTKERRYLADQIAAPLIRFDLSSSHPPGLELSSSSISYSGGSGLGDASSVSSLSFEESTRPRRLSASSPF